MYYGNAGTFGLEAGIAEGAQARSIMDGFAVQVQKAAFQVKPNFHQASFWVKPHERSS